MQPTRGTEELLNREVLFDYLRVRFFAYHPVQNLFVKDCPKQQGVRATRGTFLALLAVRREMNPSLLFPPAEVVGLCDDLLSLFRVFVLGSEIRLS